MIYDDLTLTQKNYCSLNKINNNDCVDFFDNIGDRDPIYSDLTAEQKSQCNLNQINNSDCLVYWVGKNDGTPPGTLPEPLSYDDLNQNQKNYCEDLGISDDACAVLFFSNDNYNTLTSAQKDYCDLNGLSKDKCIYHYLTLQKSDEELNDDMNNSIENQNNQILYFDDVAFQNSTLKTKNVLKQRNNTSVISYCVLNKEQELNDPLFYIQQKLGYKYYSPNGLGIQDKDYFFRHITKTEPEFNNITMEQSWQTTKWITINSPENNDELINEFIFNFEAANGIYMAADDGGFLPNSVSIRIEIVGWDKTYTRYKTYSGTLTMYTPSSIINGGGGKGGGGNKGTKGTHPGKQPIRLSGYIPVDPGYYKVRVIRNKAANFNNGKVSDNFNITRVIGVYNMNPSYKDVSLLAVRVSSNFQFSQSSALSINALVRKKSELKDSYFPYQLTLRDFVLDVWTNKKVGLGADRNDLDIRVDLNENCNLVLDGLDVGINVLQDVLKGYGYVMYPSNNTYVIDKDGPISERAYIFYEGNYKSISFNYSIPQNLEQGDGIKVKYFKQGQLELSDFTYPLNAQNPTEVVLRGLSHSSIAEATAKRMHKKNTQRGKTCTIETDLEGMIPELNSRVGIVSKYIKDSITVGIDKVEHLTINNQIQTKITLSDRIQFKDVFNKCLMLDKNLKGTTRHDIEISNEDRNYVIIPYYVEIDNEQIITVGVEGDVIEDFILEIITPSQDEAGNITSVKLNLVEYNPSVFN